MPTKSDEPKSVGRPARAGGATSMIGVRATASERKAYEAAAKSKSMTLAEWIRAACAAFMKR